MWLKDLRATLLVENVGLWIIVGLSNDFDLKNLAPSGFSSLDTLKRSKTGQMYTNWNRNVE